MLALGECGLLIISRSLSLNVCGGFFTAEEDAVWFFLAELALDLLLTFSEEVV